MKKQVLFVALATIFSMNVFAQEAARPDTAMGKPAHEAEDVMAVYCNHYTQNNLNYDVQRWDANISWEVLKLGADSTNVYYTPAMTFEGLGSNPIAARDFSAYKHLHFDVWVPDTVWISLTVETATGAKHHCPFRVNAGWNTIDADPAWWDKEGAAYDWKDVKFIIFDQYMKLDSTTYEGNPFAFANIYFWNEPAVVCPDAPADPSNPESKIMALFAKKYQTRTLAFTPTSWGAQWVSPQGYEGAYFYTASFGWDCFTNWETSSYDLSAYDMFSCDIWVELDSKIKIGFECLKPSDGGTREWKQGAHFDLQANKWNHIDVDLLNAPYTHNNYDFSDMRYMVLEGFLKPDGTSAEGTPVGITNAFFWNSMDQAIDKVDAEKAAVKRLIDGRLVIEKNGKRYNALGTEF